MKWTATRTLSTGAAALLTVFLFPFLFHWAVVTRADRTIPWDFMGYHLPHLAIMQDAWAAAEFPFWEMYNYCGRPFAANPQTQTFYLPRWWTVISASGRERMLANFELEVVTHLGLGGFFAALLSRRLGCMWYSAVISGIAYGGGCFFASQVQHAGAVEGGAWLPAIWWSVARLLQRRYARDLILLAFLTAAFLTGFTPGVLIIYASVGLLASLLIWAWKLPVRSVVPPLLTAVALSLALSGVQLVPAYELMSHSVGKYRLEWRGTGGGVPWEAFVSLLWPDFYGVSDITRFRLPYEITTCFLFGGLTPLLLIVFGLHSMKRDRGLRAFVFIFLASALLMLGDKTIAGLALWSGIPAMVRASYYPQYWLMVFSLAFAIAAGSALDRLSLPVWLKS